jgi:hypothetical protein
MVFISTNSMLPPDLDYAETVDIVTPTSQPLQKKMPCQVKKSA